MKSLKIALISLTILTPFMALAAATPNSFNSLGLNAATTTVGGLMDVLVAVVKWARVIFFTLAALMFILAAFYYLTAAGDEEKIKKAKTMFIYAIIGVVVALLSYAFAYILSNFIGENIG